MATGFKLSDGRDLSDIFTAGDAGLPVGFRTSNDVDLGRQFMGGSTGIVTGFRDPSGIDLGSRFGNDPWIAQGYTPCTMLVGYTETTSGSSTLKVKNYWTGYSYRGNKWIGSLSDLSLIGTGTDSHIDAHKRGGNYTVNFASTGSRRTAVVINGTSYNAGTTSNAQSAWDYLNARVGQNITIYLK